MPDPINSSVRSANWCAAEGGGELSSVAPYPTPNASLASAPSSSVEVPAGTALLTRQFQENHGAFVAATRGPASKSAASPANPNDQIGARLGAAHVEGHTSLGGVQLRGAIDVLSADVHLGSQNDDGSQGENVGAVLNGIGGEVTAEYGGWSLTAGVSASLGASVSSGEGRDLDGDGKPERCFKVSFGPFTLGECDEL